MMSSDSQSQGINLRRTSTVKPRRVLSPHSSLHDLINARNKTVTFEDSNERRSTSPKTNLSPPKKLKIKSRSTGSLSGNFKFSSPASTQSSLRGSSIGFPDFISVPQDKSIGDHELYWMGGGGASTRISSSSITTVRGGGSPRGRDFFGESIRGFHPKIVDSIQLQKDPFVQSNQELPIMHYSSLGDIYSNSNAMKAYKAMKLNSKSLENTKRLRLIFVNQTSKPLVLCWVDFNHNLHHYYKLHPSKRTTIIGGIGTAGYSNSFLDTRVDGGLHLEHTMLGHTFVLGIPPHDDTSSESILEQNPRNNGYFYYGDDDNDDTPPFWSPFKQKEVDGIKLDKSKIQTIIGAYRPMHLGCNSIDEDGIKEEYCVHMIQISEHLAFLPKAKIKSMPQIVFHLTLQQCEIDSTPLDTSDKEYTDIQMEGWKLKCEKGLFNRSITNLGKEQSIQNFTKRLELDLAAAKAKLPPRAYESLSKSTPFWINRSQYYGPKAAPVRGKGMCFHPHEKWLVENGMSKEKCGGIELYDATEYLEDCDLWHGQGGVILHELSHAL